MIKDKLENIERYSINDIFEKFKNEVRQAKNPPIELELPLKCIPLEYETKDFDLTKFENHHENIDIHLIVKGNECIGLKNVSDLVPETAYDENNDFQLFKGEPVEQVVLRAGEFLLLFPGEAHVTGGKAGKNSSAVEKLVYKVPFNHSNIDGK